MIHDQDIPMHLWVETTRTNAYVHNILSHSALGFKTIEELFTGKMLEQKSQFKLVNLSNQPTTYHKR